MLAVHLADQPRTQYVRSLEERLRRTETVLRAAGILDEAAINQEELYDDDELLESSSEVENDDDELSSASPNLSRAQNGNPRRLPSSDRGQASNGLKARPPLTRSARNSQPSAPCNSDLQQIPVFKMDHREESRYYGRLFHEHLLICKTLRSTGRASSLSILSREGIEWIGKKTGDTKFLNFICSSSSRDCPWDYWRADVFHDLFSSQVFKSLPPRADVFALVKNYFRTSNRLFPLYHEESFMRLVEWQYTQQTCNDAAWWASINIILALAYEYRLSDNVKPDRDREKSWLYFKNAMSVFSELTLRRTDLLSVQALLGLVRYLIPWQCRRLIRIGLLPSRQLGHSNGVANRNSGDEVLSPNGPSSRHSEASSSAGRARAEEESVLDSLRS